VTVYLRDPARAADFDRVYRERVGPVPPARTLVQSDLPGFDVEVDAILLDGGAGP
jgi:2-iminobutanoate/2-iminopropanoate deaminase